MAILQFFVVIATVPASATTSAIVLAMTGTLTVKIAYSR